MIWTEEEYAAYLKNRGKAAPKAPKKSKYNAKRTNGHASKHEDDIATEFRFDERAGAYILVEQVDIPIESGKYIADFVRLYPDGHYDVVDAKGVKTPVYKLKSKSVKARWNIEVKEV